MQRSRRPQTKAWFVDNALPQFLADFFALRVDKINSNISLGSDNFNDAEEVLAIVVNSSTIVSCIRSIVRYWRPVLCTSFSQSFPFLYYQWSCSKYSAPAQVKCMPNCCSETCLRPPLKGPSKWLYRWSPYPGSFLWR